MQGVDSDGVAVVVCVWDIDGLFNNRLLQIEQLVVRRSASCARSTPCERRRSVVCIHLGRRNKRKGETSEQLEKKKKKKKKLRREFIIVEGHGRATAAQVWRGRH